MKTTSKFSLSESRESAVSEAIGFLLIFSLVMVGIGLVTLYGYPMLLETQSNANVRNMERDMIVLQNDMKSLVYKNVPYKETSLQVSGGALAVYNYSMKNTTFSFSSDNGTIDSELVNSNLNTVKCGHFIYESDKGESIIALENGAVLTRMEFQQGSAMLAEPRWYIDEINNTKTFVITLMNIITDNVMSRNGIGIVKMRASNPEYYAFTDSDGMTITVQYTRDSSKFDFSKGWGNYFVNSLNMNNTAPNIYKIYDVNNLIIKQYEIKILSI